MRCKCCDDPKTTFKYDDWYCTECAEWVAQAVLESKEQKEVDWRYYSVNKERE